MDQQHIIHPSSRKLSKRDNHSHCNSIDIHHLHTNQFRLSIRDAHFAFRSRDINPVFASSLIECETFPERNLAICVIKGVGTTRWFLLPISTFPISLIQGKGIYGGEDSEVIVGEVA